MNWGAMMLVIMMSINLMCYAGFTILPLQLAAEGWEISPTAYSFAQSDSLSFVMMGELFEPNFNITSNKTWGKPNSTAFGRQLTSGTQGGILGQISDTMAAYLGAAGNALAYTWGFVAMLGHFLSGPFILFYTLGIPQPILGIISVLWTMLFFTAIVSFVTGRWQ